MNDSPLQMGRVTIGPDLKMNFSKHYHANSVWELMVPLEWNGFNIRVWWTHEGELGHAEVRELVRLRLDEVSIDDSVFDIAKHVCGLTSVAAIEILDIDGQGVVFYPDWK